MGGEGGGGGGGIELLVRALTEASARFLPVLPTSPVSCQSTTQGMIRLASSTCVRTQL